jgi:hypothetical protein
MLNQSTTSGRDQFIYLLNQAFDANDEHSLLANLRSVPIDAWMWLPDGAERSIVEIVFHIGQCKYVYDDHAFGAANLTWDAPLIEQPYLHTVRSEQERDRILDWLGEGQRRLVESIEALDDDEELGRKRMTNWGRPAETRWIISVMIEHDLYHAGEINHLRSLYERKDRWAFLED